MGGSQLPRGAEKGGWGAQRCSWATCCQPALVLGNPTGASTFWIPELPGLLRQAQGFFFLSQVDGHNIFPPLCKKRQVSLDKLTWSKSIKSFSTKSLGPKPTDVVKPQVSRDGIRWSRLQQSSLVDSNQDGGRGEEKAHGARGRATASASKSCCSGRPRTGWPRVASVPPKYRFPSQPQP